MFDYGPAPQGLVDRAVAMQRACEEVGVSLRAALQFPGRHPAVKAVASGAGSVKSVTDMLAQVSSPIPEWLWDELEVLAGDRS